MRKIPWILLVVSLVAVTTAQGDLDQDDVVVDPGGGNLNVRVTRGGTEEGPGEPMTLRDDIMDLAYYMCASSKDGSEQVRQAMFVTDRWYTKPRVVILRQEGEFVRFYVDGTVLVGAEYSCDHTNGECENAGLPGELSGELETGLVYWTTMEGQLKSDDETKIQLLNADENEGC